MLNLPGKALEILEGRSDWATMQFEASLADGRGPTGPRPISGRPQATRAGRLAQARRHRRRHRPGLVLQADAPPGPGHRRPRPGRPAQSRSALLHYNLSCYWSLAGNPAKALEKLADALDLDPDLRTLIPNESDFDALRGNPDFDRLTADPATTT